MNKRQKKNYNYTEFVLSHVLSDVILLNCNFVIVIGHGISGYVLHDSNNLVHMRYALKPWDLELIMAKGHCETLHTPRGVAGAWKRWVTLSNVQLTT